MPSKLEGYWYQLNSLDQKALGAVPSHGHVTVLFEPSLSEPSGTLHPFTKTGGITVYCKLGE